VRSLVVFAAVALVAAVLAGVSGAAVRKLSFTAAASGGDQVSLTVAVSPKARCTTRVV
jgi:hypothetical protein